MSEWGEIVHHFNSFLRVNGKLPSTADSYYRDAKGFINYLELLNIDPSMAEGSALIEYKNYLAFQQHERPNSVRRAMIGVRQFYRYLAIQGMITSSPFDHLPIPERDERLPDLLTLESIEALLQATKSLTPRHKACRDALLIALMAYDGLKATELINLKWEHVRVLDTTTFVHIAGGRSRRIEIDSTCHYMFQALRQALKASDDPDLEPKEGRYVLQSFKGRGSKVVIQQMTRHGLKFILYELGKSTNIKVNAELLRHFAISNLISRGMSEEELRRHLGLRTSGNIAKHTARGKEDVPQ